MEPVELVVEDFDEEFILDADPAMEEDAFADEIETGVDDCDWEEPDELSSGLDEQDVKMKSITVRANGNLITYLPAMRTI
jgi:hypothetical protein